MANMQPKIASKQEDEKYHPYRILDAIMARNGYGEDCLIEVLFTAQTEFGSLSRELLTYVAEKLGIPLSRVYGVVTFYDMFSLTTPGTVPCQICTGPICTVLGGDELLAEVYAQTGEPEAGISGPKSQYEIQPVSCLGLCDQAPAALVAGKPQVELTAQQVPALLKGEAQVPMLQITGPVRELTAPIGRIAPTDLPAHRKVGAFEAYAHALLRMSPGQVVSEVKDARLTGRGGANFSTGLKWDLTRRASNQPKYVVCNFDESEPGTFKDRVLMEGNPFRVLEGLALSAYASGAEEGYIFIRGEYPQATAVVEEALEEVSAAGLFGEDILGSGHHFQVEIRRNAGAYICGEETALFEAIEGRRGYPRRKPPYPTESGLFGQPTTINNVETLAVIPSLVLHGGEWFHQWGTPQSTGLKLFCLSGHIHAPGVVEAPYGVPVREMIETYGGGFKGEPQAVLIGGAAGGFLSPAQLDTPLTHEDLNRYDVPIGSGAIMVFNQGVDLWKVLEGLAAFFVHESCGQCAPCRIGTQQIYRILQKTRWGSLPGKDLDRAQNLGQTIRTACVCGLGKTAANPLLTYLRNLEGIV
jgi:NADH-quinone oxidoreductase subunit F